jgi:hypothetical protein
MKSKFFLYLFSFKKNGKICTPCKCSTAGGGAKEKDEEGISPLVLSCRGEKTRTSDPLHPMQVR